MKIGNIKENKPLFSKNHEEYHEKEMYFYLRKKFTLRLEGISSKTSFSLRKLNSLKNMNRIF